MARLAEWLTKRVTFSMRGQKWPLVFTHRALFMCQELTGLDMIAVNLTNPSASLVRALLFAALDGAGANCTIKEVGQEVGRIGLASARRTLVAAWAASMAEPGIEQHIADPGAPECGWMDAWSAAREELRLAADEWLDITPRMFAALQKSRLGTLQREEFLVGLVVATLQNFSMSPPKKPAKPESFMLHKLPELPIGDQIMAEMAKFRGIN